MISIDGFTGEVFKGKVEDRPSEILQVLINKTLKPAESETYKRYEQLMTWVDENRKLKVRTNADKPKQALEAIAFGAEGIGLCRTEHMFFDHIDDFREMILADTLADREKALLKLLPFQRKDFDGLFRAMNGRPVTIRLLDPPLHEFLPHRVPSRPSWARRSTSRPRPSPAASPSCTSSIPCWGIAVAAWASSIPKSRGCRPAPSSKRPAT